MMATMPICPVVMPLRDDQNRYNPLGAYLSLQAITLACFPGKQALSFWSPYGTFNDYGLLSHSGYDQSHVLQELIARTGAASSAEGSLSRKNGGWVVHLDFKDAGKTAAYTKTFKKNQIHLIPGWMAERVHAWMGTRLSKAQKAYLKNPLFNDDAALNRGLVLDDFNFQTVQNVPGWDGLAAANKRSPYILFRDYYTQKNIDGITDLKPMEDLVQKDPKNDLAKFFLMNMYRNEGMYGKSLDLAFYFLSADQTNPNYYSSVTDLLENLGDYGNARYIYEKLAARFPNNAQVQEALGSYYRHYAWSAGGGGWDGGGFWNAVLYKKRLEMARASLEKARGLNPQDCRIYSELIQTGAGLKWKNEELDKVLDQSVSIDPNYEPTFEQRLNVAADRRENGNDDEMAFARKWRNLHPRLMLLAIRSDGGNQTGGKELEYYRYLGSPKVWPEYKKAREESLKNFKLDDYQTWVEYAYEASKIDKVPDFLAFLQEESKTDDILEHFRPYLENLVYAYRADAIGWQHTGQLYLNSKEVWPELYKDTLDVIKQDPDNYPFLNTQAASFTGWGRFKSARKVFEAIGDHWVPKVWTKGDFEKKKRVAYGLEAPTWHLCLSTKDAEDEK
jgi:hypothetical protein